MEELGLNLVDDLGVMLRQLMRITRQHSGSADTLIKNSVSVYVEYVGKHPSYFHFMSQARTGGTFALRQAIRNELKYFANELVMDIQQGALLSKVSTQDLEMIAQLVVGTVEEITIDLLDLKDSSETYQQELVNRTEKKLRLIFLGARVWRSS